jgi:hypothetical protein
MSNGKCGVHKYANITQAKIDKMLEVLKSKGYNVKGNNPWTIDTKSHGVVLQGSWDESTSTLSIIVLDKDWYVPCSKIWDTVDPLIGNLSTLSLDDNETLVASSNGKCGVHKYANISQAKIDKMLEVLKSKGYNVKGNNPWTIDTKSHGVVLQGTWDESTSTLSIIVLDKDWYVPCSKIWDTVDPLIHGLGKMDF